eukprot:364995-Chlamydomonas_euryale.AAC.12
MAHAPLAFGMSCGARRVRGNRGIDVPVSVRVVPDMPATVRGPYMRVHVHVATHSAHIRDAHLQHTFVTH